MKTKKMLAALGATLLMGAILIGCNATMFYTFDVYTGEQVKVKVDITDGAKLTQANDTFTITGEDGAKTLGVFCMEEDFNYLYENVADFSDTEVIESGSWYVFYKASDEAGSEWNYLVDLKDTETGIALVNATSEASAREAFKSVAFEVNPN